MTTITIPRKLMEKGDLILIPKKEYEQLVKLSQRLFWEEQDTDGAIKTFNREKRLGKLKSAHNFSSILKAARRHE